MDRVHLENMIKAFQRYGDGKFPSLYEESRAEKSNKLFQGLRGVQNVYSQHQPLIKTLLTDLIKRRGGGRQG